MNAIRNSIHEAALADLDRLKERSTRSWRSDPAGDDPNTGWTHATTYIFADGEAVTLNGKHADDILIPAAPGLELIEVWDNDQTDISASGILKRASRNPVIGWCLSFYQGDCLVLPIAGTEWNLTGGSKCYAVVSADGRVSAPTSVHASVDEWALHTRRIFQQQREQRALEAERRALAKKPCPHCGRCDRDLDDEIPF